MKSLKKRLKSGSSGLKRRGLNFVRKERMMSESLTEYVTKPFDPIIAEE